MTLSPRPEDQLRVASHGSIKEKKRSKAKKAKPHAQYLRRKKRNSLWPWVLKWIFVLLIWFVFLGGVFFLWFSYDLPDIMKLQQTERRPSIIVLAKDGTKLATYGDLHGQLVETQKLPSHIIQAILAIEDRRFYSHYGIDPVGLLRALWTNYRTGHVVQGGSTLTQQLAKNFLQTEKLYKVHDRSLRRKIQEILLALWLEHKFTKNQLLTLYLNRIYLGSGTFGLAAAAQHYFGKHPQDLSLYEAAVIAGLLKAPSKYSPSSNPHLANQRAAQVLENMVKEGTITEGAKEAALMLASSSLETFRGSTTRYFTDWIVNLAEILIPQTDKDLIITTTLDPYLQTLAESKLGQVMREKSKKTNVSQMALVSMTYDGAVRALIGGVNYRKSQFNRATQALRQTGSTFKLVLYLAALEAGMHPEDQVSDLPIRLGSWNPKNYKYNIRGEISLQDAMAYSANTVSVRLAHQLGLSRIVQTARRLGLTAPLPDNLTVVLGTGETTLLDLTAAYGVIAKGGLSFRPYGILKITDHEGHVIYTYQAPQTYQIVDPTIAQNLIRMMQAVMTYGTGKRAAINGFCAGKTGTTQKYKDFWLIAFNHSLITGVWAGNDNNTSLNSTAGSPSARLWHLYMSEASQNAFPVEQKTTQPVDHSSGSLIEGLLENLFGQ